MAHFTYELDEFQPWPGLAVYVYGSAVITYQWEGPDPDVGYRGGPYDIEIESITVGDSPMPKTHPLYDAIESALVNSDHVAAMCVEDHEELASSQIGPALAVPLLFLFLIHLLGGL